MIDDAGKLGRRRYLRDAVASAARDIVRDPTSAMKYLRGQLLRLTSVWDETLPATEILKDRAKSIATLLATLDRGLPTIEDQFEYLFGDVVDWEDALPKATKALPRNVLTLGVLVESFEDASWTRFAVLRLDALWAMRKTIGSMQALCDDSLAVEPFGTMLREQEDIAGSTEQPVLRRDELAKLIKSLAPNAPESYLRSVDQKALPELLKSLATVVFPELQAHIWGLIPGGRT